LLNYDSCYQVSDRAVERVVSNISNSITGLQSLNVNFNWCKSINDSGVMQISQDMCFNLVNLRHLTLVSGVYDNGISDERYQKVDPDRSRFLKKLEFLNVFWVNCTDMTDKRLKAISTQIGTHLGHLKEITYGFQSCNKLTDQGLDIFTSTLANYVTGLRKLHLDFAYCEQITDEGVRKVGQNLRNPLPNLKSLSIGFS